MDINQENTFIFILQTIYRKQLPGWSLQERNVNNQHLPETCSLWVVAGLTLNGLQVEISHSVAYWQKYRSILFYTVLKPLLLFYQFLIFSLCSMCCLQWCDCTGQKLGSHGSWPRCSTTQFAGTGAHQEVPPVAWRVSCFYLTNPKFSS